MSGKKSDSKQQQGNTKDSKNKKETSQKGKQTPQGGTKRFLTPSPVHPNESLKKSRQVSGGLSDVKKRLNLDEELETQEVAVVEGVEEMSVAFTMDDKDVKQIASELQELILPDLWQLISSQIPDFKNIVDGAIKSAVSQINETLLKEINTVKEENSELKKSVSTLEQKVIKLQRDVDDGLKTAYSSDGRVYVKDNNDARHLIIDQADLWAFGSSEPLAIRHEGTLKCVRTLIASDIIFL